MRRRCCCTGNLVCSTCAGDVPAQQLVSPGSGTDPPSLFQHFSNTEDIILDYYNDGPITTRIDDNPANLVNYPYNIMSSCYWSIYDDGWYLDFFFVGIPTANRFFLLEFEVATSRIRVRFDDLATTANLCIGPVNPFNGGASKFVEGV